MNTRSLLREATVEDLVEARSMLLDGAGSPLDGAGSPGFYIRLAAAALSLIAEGRESGAFKRWALYGQQSSATLLCDAELRRSLAGKGPFPPPDASA